MHRLYYAITNCNHVDIIIQGCFLSALLLLTLLRMVLKVHRELLTTILASLFILLAQSSQKYRIGKLQTSQELITMGLTSGTIQSLILMRLIKIKYMLTVLCPILSAKVLTLLIIKKKKRKRT